MFDSLAHLLRCPLTRNKLRLDAAHPVYCAIMGNLTMIIVRSMGAL